MGQTASHVLRVVGVILGLTLIISLIVIVIGLVFHWDQSTQFSNGFFIAGAIVIVLGTFSVTGGLQQRASFPLAYAETASDASISERAQRMMTDINQRYGFMAVFLGSGVLLIAISIAIGNLF